MTKIGKQVVIERPQEDVAAIARDWRNIPRYFDYIKDVRPLTEETAGLGARYLVRLRFLGRDMTSEWEMVEDQGDEGWAFVTPLMGVVARKTWSFQPMGDATSALLTLEYQPRPPIVGPLLDIMLLKRRWVAITTQGMEGLKRLAEAQA